MSERRRYFRIDDYVELSYLCVDQNTVDTGRPETLFADAPLLNLQAEFKKIDSESSQLLYQIRDLDRHLGDYLHLLNRKIDLMAQQLMAKQVANAEERVPREVNLSEGGVAFSNAEAVEPGQYLAVHLLFLPSYTGVVLFARVARCEPHRNGQYEIAANFHRPTSIQKQLLSQQIMRAQLADKRRQQEQ